MNTLKTKVSEWVASIQANDPALANEINHLRNTDAYQTEAVTKASTLITAKSNLESLDTSFALETIVLRVGRPVLSIYENQAILQFSNVESAVWKERLEAAKPRLTTGIQSVGRIEVQNHPVFDWLGTGWLVDDEVIVTNRHVAKEFARKDGMKFIFRRGSNGNEMGASIDFLEEANRPDEFVFSIEDILHIENDAGPDLAFLKVKHLTTNKIPKKIALSGKALSEKQDIAAIGYPARDSRIPDQQLIEDIFGNIFDKKRLAPGQITKSSANELLHDCSTAGGNSGSVLLDLATGEAVGIHFAGRFLEANFAVPAAVIRQRLTALSGYAASRSENNTPPAPPATLSAPQPATIIASTNNTHHMNSIQVTIPITVTVSIGTAVAVTANVIPVPAVTAIPDKEETFITEGQPTDYADRTGYDENFLGDDFNVPLPQVTNEAKKKDILTYELNGHKEQILTYQHFSVVMSKSRRQCFYSAVNIDGPTSVGMDRGGWRLDPRIPAEQQIMKECYGNPPKFSRGHMTRREDPIWGELEEAARGNSDSMHVTNTVPQMQPMNAGIWLGLENYALQNARKDKQRISVFTGPVFKPGDPTRYGVVIPLTFWKIIVFIHDETGELCATGYEMSQKSFLAEEEFVYGKHATAQRKISRIEKNTGLFFGNLASLDPLNTATELLESDLLDFDQIRFF